MARLLFDEMLKRLASWSRILGIDSEFLVGKSDSELMAFAKKNGFVFVTRDLPLSVRCEKHGVKFILVRSDKIEEQIAQLLEESGAEITFPDKTRCASCNGELEDIPKEKASGSVHDSVLQRNDRFWRCVKCGKVFWEGSHWRNIRKIMEKADKIRESGG
jgi:hypothetical protein